MNIAENVQTWLNHVRVLSVEVGPRGSTTDGERKGAEYCQVELDNLGLRAVTETFQSAQSIFLPHLLASGLMVLSFLIYPIAGGWSAGMAFLIALLSLSSELLELAFISNPIRWVIPKGRSQNVVATISPSGEHRQDLVLIGHIDTQRTPLIFHSKAWVEAYKSFTTIAFMLFTSQVILFLLGWIFQWNWIWFATIPSVLGALVLAAICIQADRTPFTAGANDNATAVGMVLTLAEQLGQSPLQHTRVYLTCTGCEEVQHYGAIDFFKRHRDEMVKPRALVFEMLGCAGPAWLTKEGIIVPFYSDKDLMSLVEHLSRQNPHWGAYPVQINGGNTELADCARFTVPALTLFGMTQEGDAPYWHQVEDTFDKMNQDVMAKTYEMTWELIQAMDREVV
jgi:hypothetical protein